MENGTIAGYTVYYTYGITADEVNTTNNTFKLEGLGPGTNVNFTVRPFTICSTTGQEVSITEATESIREHSIHACT